jgi:uncharacterized protein
MKNALQSIHHARGEAALVASFLLVGLAMLMLAAPNAAAVEVTSLYTAEAPYDRNDPDGRAGAYASALSQVLARITGIPDPLQAPEIAGLIPDPARYVLQYRPGEDDSLWITFDGPAIERLLRSANVTVWGSDRPLTLVWLAVDWGQGEREIVAAGDPERLSGEERSIDRNRLLRERVEEAALRRGIPVAFPLMDAEDRESVSFSDIWGGFDDLLLKASRRYGANSILVGRVRPASADRNRWSWYFGGDRREWTGEAEEAVTLLANSLASQFAIAGNAELDTFGVTVSGIDSVAAYGAVQSYLETLDIVDNLAIDSVSADRVSYRVRAHGGLERLRRVLEVSSILEPVDAFGRGDRAGTAAGLEFRYRQ